MAILVLSFAVVLLYLKCEEYRRELERAVSLIEATMCLNTRLEDVLKRSLDAVCEFGQALNRVNKLDPRQVTENFQRCDQQFLDVFARIKRIEKMRNIPVRQDKTYADFVQLEEGVERARRVVVDLDDATKSYTRATSLSETALKKIEGFVSFNHSMDGAAADIRTLKGRVLALEEKGKKDDRTEVVRI